MLQKIIKLVRILLIKLHLYRWILARVRSLKGKPNRKPKKIGFVVYQEAVWKCDQIVKMINENSSSSATIIIMPISSGKTKVKKDWLQAVKFFSLNYKLVEKCERPDSLWQILKTFWKYDTVVFSDCWNLSNSLWFELILIFKDCRYIPYSHQVSNYANHQAQYNQLFHNLAQRIYQTNKFESDIFEAHSDVKNDNTLLLGYPGVTKFIAVTDNSENKNILFPKDPWVRLPSKKKRIIWAPHHSILWENRRYSNFLQMHEYMLHLVGKYKAEVNFAFKPHPMLREELKKIWDEAKVDNFYHFWSQNDNTLLSEGEYGGLFAYSDALIHDCGSFIAEYTYLRKPHGFILSSNSIKDDFNQFGQKCMETTVLIQKTSEIDSFIEKIIQNSCEQNVESKKFIDEIMQVSRSCEVDIIKDFGIQIFEN